MMLLQYHLTTYYIILLLSVKTFEKHTSQLCRKKVLNDWTLVNFPKNMNLEGNEFKIFILVFRWILKIIKFSL